MRHHLLILLLLTSTPAPLLAQREPTLDRRVGKLEGEMRAVQRKVFPGGRPPLEAEIRPQQVPLAPSGAPASSAMADLTARVDALEGQLQTLTGQLEESAFRVRQVEETLNRFRTETENRLARVERPEPTPTEAPAETSPEGEGEPAAEPDGDAGAAQPADDAEAAYLAGFKLWQQNRFADAQKALEAMAKKYPRHRLASWAQNLAGRAYLDEGKPAAAAKVLLANYQNNPKGERAADSLYFLGTALTQLNKTAEACQVYAELEDVYGAGMRDFLKQNLPKARAAAKCG